MLDPIIKTIEVSCSQERAFEIFLMKWTAGGRAANLP